MTRQRFSVDTDILGFWDALLVEAARVAGVTRLLTEDRQDARRVGALRLEAPFKTDPRPAWTDPRPRSDAPMPQH